VKLIRVGAPGAEVPAVLGAEGQRYDVSSITGDFDAAFFAAGGIADLQRRWAAGEIASLPTLPAEARLGAPIVRPGHLVCAGLNYADHAAESGMAIPEEPLLFTKAPNTVIGPTDDVHIPRGATKVDYEVELGIVIGSTCRYLDSPADAWSHIAGFVVSNDVSERAFQLDHGGQWMKGKSAETFNPLGPWLVTTDEVDVAAGLDLWLDVDGQRRQTGRTTSLIFGVDVLLHYISQFLVLDPGDLVNTGTPPGVAMGMAEPAWVQTGQVVTAGISGLGEQRSHFVTAP
jgi:2-keto-4-pentenoate hydratase/2-oxohepta-3-ene-1,7-dioic acid hydratase in catechol pathway